jgi:hypothetical protein
MRVVVLGGAGNFGTRIVRSLQDDADIEVIAAGRRALLVTGAESVRVVSLDVMTVDFPAQLAALAPGLVIHCVGPFQQQGYAVAEATLAAGAHYLDLADGREFVAGFAPALQAKAVAARRVAITGASTLPALSSAVVESLRAGLQSVECIDIAIAPAQRAPRGDATLAAVFSYLGRPIRVWRAGQWRRSWGWMDLRCIRFAFGPRWSAACDVPDLAVLPERYPEVQSVRFHAALEFGMQHFVLWALAGLRRIGVALPVERWAGPLNRCAAWFDPLGGEWGGMQVSVVGMIATGVRVRRTWQLTAPALHGPEIPTLSAILLARRLARGESFKPGAYSCLGFLTLREFEPEFARWGITTKTEECGA